MGRGCCPGPFRGRPQGDLSAPPTCPYHPTFLSRSAPADVLAVMEVAEHSVPFFAGIVHELEVTKEGYVDAEEEIHFAISGFAPPPPPPAPSGPPHCGTWGTPPQRGTAPMHARRGPIISCPFDCNVCPLCISVCLLAFSTNWTKFAPNTYEIRTIFVRTNVCGTCVNKEVSVKLVRNLYEIRTNFTQICANFVQAVYRLRSVSPIFVPSALPL